MKTIPLAIAATLLGLGTMANAQGYDGNRKLDHFTRSAFMATLDRIGATYEETDGARNITIKFENGLVADGLLLACEDEPTSTNCLGTSILVTFDTPEDVTHAKVVDAINEYNYRQNFGRAYLDPDGVITIRMYMIADGGITMGNYRRQLSLFALSAAKLPGYVYE